MEERVRVVVDAMGGDNAPDEIIKGSVMAVNSSDEVEVILVGPQDLLEEKLKAYDCKEGRISIVHAGEVIGTDEQPAYAIKKKKDSSIVVGQRLIREGKADAFVSAGSTGAVLVGGQVLVGRIKGIERPALAPLIPTTKGCALLIDCGANVDAKPSNLAQFAKMGSIYMENIVGVKNPAVGLLNIGAEEEKGNQLVKDTMPLLRQTTDINFIGSCEARDVPTGYADVVVCEAFAGNVLLKTYEGVAKALMSTMKKSMTSSLKTKIGALLIKNELKQELKQFDVSEHGGAPLLGLKGLVVKAHGSSSAKEINICIHQCIDFSRAHIAEKIAASLKTTDTQTIGDGQNE